MIKKYQLSQLVVLLILFTAANYKTLQFYFWHDDFSSFYGPLLNKCIHGWPYYSFCTIFDQLVKNVGYNPLPYFLIGNVLAALSMLLFYYLLLLLFKDNKIAFFLSTLVASSYIAAGVFFEAWDPLVSFSTTATLILSLIICLKSINKGFDIRLFLLSLAVLLFSVSLFNFRSSTNFVPFVMIILLFSNVTISLAKRITLSGVVLVSFILTFFIIPLYLIRIPLDGFYPQIDYLAFLTNPSKIKYLFQTLSSFVFPDTLATLFPVIEKNISIIRLIVGIAICSAYMYFLLKDRSNSLITHLRIFALVWIISLFFPYWLRNDFYLNSTHRYILWIYPGILIAWGTFAKYRFWKIATILLLVIYFISTHNFYNNHLSLNLKMRSFYNQLHDLIPSIDPGSVVYFNYPPSFKGAIDDFFRVGFTPPESALGTEFKVDYTTIKLVTNSDVLSRLIDGGKVSEQNLLAFFYDGETLINITQDARYLLMQNKKTETLNQIQLPTIIYDSASKLWKGESKELNFSLIDNKNLLPQLLNFKIKANAAEIKHPYLQTCLECDQSLDRQSYLSFLSSSRLLKNSLILEAAEASENTDEKNIIDNDQKTYWLYDRMLWNKGQRGAIKMIFKDEALIDGVIVFSSYARGLPSKMLITVNGKEKTEVNPNSFPGGNKFIFTGRKVETLELQILETQGNDTPLVNEIEIIPAKYSSIDVIESLRVDQSPVLKLNNAQEIDNLNRYLASGAKACLKWSAPGFIGGKEFILFVDNQVHDYSIQLPALGREKPVFSISCLNYPVELELISLSY